MTAKPRIGSLFSGAGGLDMAVEEVFGGHTVWQSEIDPAASKVLAHRLPNTPNLGDITQVDWADVPPVGVLCGGFPCQDVSAAGKRAGIKAGTRSGLWSVFAEAIDQLRPEFVVIENVRGLLSATAHRDMEPSDAAMGIGGRVPVLRAAGAVLGDLADLGYDAQWTTLAAAAVGAPHRRERVFILASAAADSERERLSGAGGASISIGTSVVGRRSSRSVGESARLVGGSDAALRCDEAVDLLPTPRSSDCFGAGQHGDGGMDLRTTVIENASQWGKYAPAIARWKAVLGRPAPAPTEPNKNGKPRLSAAFSEWLMGWPEGWVTGPDIALNDQDPRPNHISRVQQLKCIGNGVVPRQAAAALRYLLTVREVAA